MMRSFNVRRAASVGAAMMLLIGGGALPIGAVLAQSAAPKNSAQELMQAGLKAQKARNHAAAVAHFSRAISTGGLARKQMAYALYYRAISNRVQKQSAQAISDLNSALFFKGDLSSRDRANAIEERMKAFKDAGLAPTSIATGSAAAPSPDTGPAKWLAATRASKPAARAPKRRVISTAPRRVVEPIKVVKPAKLAAAVPWVSATLAPKRSQPKAGETAAGQLPMFQTRVSAAPVQPKPVPAQSSSFQSFLTPKVERGVGITKQQPARRHSKQPPAAPASWHVSTHAKPVAVSKPSGGWQQRSLAPASVKRGPVTVAKAEPAAAVNTTSGFGQFFSSILGSGEAVSPGVTGSIARPEVKPAAASEQPIRSWATPEQPSLAPATRPTQQGTFEIEVARLRSKDRAEAMAKQLMVQYSSGGFWGAKHTAQVHKNAGVGDAGAVYAVRYGRFQSRDGTTELCEQFKANGLSCNVVALN